MKNKNYKQRAIEVRNASVTENDGKMILEGYAVVFNSPTVIWREGDIEYKELISADAFKHTDMSDCCLKYNHGGMLMARVRGGSLQLTVDNVGLNFKAELFNITKSRDVYELVKNGALDKCSFAFTVKEESYNKDTHTRTILDIEKLYDVAVVDIPAYGDTSVSARSLFEMDIENERKELDNLKLRNELICRTYL